MHFFVTHVVVPYMPHHSAPRLGSVCPHSGIAPWARREGPSMAQRGYPGIHAGMPTPQCLRSASVVNGASKINVHREAA
ncbi:nucleoid-structuring protein H-NS [Pseudomonas sp. E141]|uniref:nucleoid-structuring protein H-NS n=1 Tax=Pseudomonas sp. E141 TaxID=2875961 RepID=UPI0040456247